MSHKVHPKIFRIRNNDDWDSRWIGKKKFSEFLEGDFKIREFLSIKLKESAVEKIEIERFSGKISVTIQTSRPGLIIGRGGEGIEKLKEELRNKVLKLDKKTELRIEIKGIRDPWTRSTLVAQSIAQQIEKRLPYRRILKQAISKIMAHKEIKGVRVEVAGRLNGTEISRKEWLKKGRLPLQTLRADIDYGTARARCSYGTIGIKVWIYKGDKF